MRSFGIVIVLFLWFLVLYKTCEDRKRCCTESDISTVLPVDRLEKSCPICFKWQGIEPQLCDDWNTYRDSLVNNMSSNQYLQITGFYVKNEIENGEELATQRAKAVKSLFSTAFAERSIQLGSQMLKSKSKQACRDMLKFSIIEKDNNKEVVAKVGDSAKLQKSGDKILVYFPYNSSNKLSDSEIENYLNDLATSLQSSKDRIRIEGHTDDQGSSKDNLMLGQKRTDMIKQYLMDRGVAKSQIITISRGETRPIADNATDAGRSKNRRTELQIIKN